jgi:hypothetical protein
MDYHYVKTVDTDAQGLPTQPGSINDAGRSAGQFVRDVGTG